MNSVGVAFDFNGTLFFDTPFHVQAWDQVSRALGAGPVDERTMTVRYSGLTNLAILQKIRPHETMDWYEEWSQKKEALYRQAVAAMPGGAHLAPGAEETFAWLSSERVPFTIASASIRENIVFFVSTFHLDRWLDPSLIVYDDGTCADKTAMYLEAQKRLRVSRLIVFEDALSGIAAAARVPGVSLIVIDSKTLAPYYDQFPCIRFRIRDFTEARRPLEVLLAEGKRAGADCSFAQDA